MPRGWPSLLRVRGESGVATLAQACGLDKDASKLEEAFAKVKSLF
jgi:hypothetical protein